MRVSGRLEKITFPKAGKCPPEKGCFSEKRATSLLLGRVLARVWLLSLAPWEDHVLLAPYSWGMPQQQFQRGGLCWRNSYCLHGQAQLPSPCLGF